MTTLMLSAGEAQNTSAELMLLGCYFGANPARLARLARCAVVVPVDVSTEL
jgi:hypothetical protein